MENRRYDFRTAPERENIKWPNDAKLAFWICPNIEYFHVDIGCALRRANTSPTCRATRYATMGHA